MILRQDLVDYLAAYLSCEQFPDYAPNGLQIEGRKEIQRVCTAVTASASVIAQAIALDADALLVHHGYFWKGEDPRLTGMKRNRIASLLQHQMNLLAYHLPLDCHLTIGNNACVAKLLDIESPVSHSVNQIQHLLWSGTLPKMYPPEMLINQLTKIFKQKPIHIAGGNSPIEHIAWCTGGAQDYIQAAKDLGADAYISGEISERTYYQAKELGIHYFACGHHATERYGIQALGGILNAQFNLEHHFLDEDNPI